MILENLMLGGDLCELLSTKLTSRSACEEDIFVDSILLLLLNLGVILRVLWEKLDAIEFQEETLLVTLRFLIGHRGVC